MVCKHCGNQLSLEDEICPFCGMENEAAKKHTEEMRHFSGQFHQVKTEALEETGRVRRGNARKCLSGGRLGREASGTISRSFLL